MHLKGVLILSNLEINEQVPLPTHEQVEGVENPMPGKEHRRCDMENHPDGKGQNTGARPKVYDRPQTHANRNEDT